MQVMMMIPENYTEKLGHYAKTSHNGVKFKLGWLFKILLFKMPLARLDLWQNPSQFPYLDHRSNIEEKSF